MFPGSDGSHIPHIPSRGNTVSKHHAYKSVSKEKSTISRASQLWLPSIPASNSGIANSRQTGWKRRPVNNFPFVNCCLNVNCYLVVQERLDCTFHYCPAFSSKKPWLSGNHAFCNSTVLLWRLPRDCYTCSGNNDRFQSAAVKMLHFKHAFRQNANICHNQLQACAE